MNAFIVHSEHKTDIFAIIERKRIKWAETKELKSSCYQKKNVSMKKGNIMKIKR